MKLLKCLFLLVCLSGFCATGALAQRTIRSISVVFNTTNDDKDDNTNLVCQVLRPDNSWLAQASGQFGRFPDNTAYTLNLTMGNAYYADWLLNQTSLYVWIGPDGDDTWNFGWTVIVTLSDGSQRTATGTASLNEHANVFKLPIF